MVECWPVCWPQEAVVRELSRTQASFVPYALSWQVPHVRGLALSVCVRKCRSQPVRSNHFKSFRFSSYRFSSQRTKLGCIQRLNNTTRRITFVSTHPLNCCLTWQQ